MIRLVRAELRKILTTRLWIGLLIGGTLLALLGAIAYVAVAGSPQGLASGVGRVETLADVETLVYGGAIVAAFAVVLGVTMATAEYRYGTAAVSALAEPRRVRVLTAKMLAAFPLGFAFGLVGAVASLAVAAGTFLLRGDPLPLGGVIWVDVAKVGVQAAFGAAFAVGIGAAVRSQLVAILGLLGWLFIVEPLAASLIPDIARWLPFSGAQAAFGPATQALVSVAVGAGLMFGYLVTAWYVAWWFDRRRDV